MLDIYSNARFKTNGYINYKPANNSVDQKTDNSKESSKPWYERVIAWWNKLGSLGKIFFSIITLGILFAVVKSAERTEQKQLKSITPTKKDNQPGQQQPGPQQQRSPQSNPTIASGRDFPGLNLSHTLNTNNAKSSAARTLQSGPSTQPKRVRFDVTRNTTRTIPQPTLSETDKQQQAAEIINDKTPLTNRAKVIELFGSVENYLKKVVQKYPDRVATEAEWRGLGLLPNAEKWANGEIKFSGRYGVSGKTFEKKFAWLVPAEQTLDAWKKNELKFSANPVYIDESKKEQQVGSVKGEKVFTAAKDIFPPIDIVIAAMLLPEFNHKGADMTEVGRTTPQEFYDFFMTRNPDERYQYWESIANSLIKIFNKSIEDISKSTGHHAGVIYSRFLQCMLADHEISQDQRAMDLYYKVFNAWEEYKTNAQGLLKTTYEQYLLPAQQNFNNVITQQPDGNKKYKAELTELSAQYLQQTMQAEEHVGEPASTTVTSAEEQKIATVKQTITGEEQKIATVKRKIQQMKQISDEKINKKGINLINYRCALAFPLPNSPSLKSVYGGTGQFSMEELVIMAMDDVGLAQMRTDVLQHYGLNDGSTGLKNVETEEGQMAISRILQSTFLQYAIAYNVIEESQRYGTNQHALIKALELKKIALINILHSENNSFWDMQKLPDNVSAMLPEEYQFTTTGASIHPSMKNQPPMADYYQQKFTTKQPRYYQSLLNDVKKAQVIKRMDLKDDILEGWLGDLTQEEAEYFVDFCENYNITAGIPTQENLDNFIKFIKFNSVQLECIEAWLEANGERTFSFPGFGKDKQTDKGNGITIEILRSEHDVQAGGKGAIVQFTDPFGFNCQYLNHVGDGYTHTLGTGIAAQTTPGVDQNFWLGREEFFNKRIHDLMTEYQGRVTCGNIHHNQSKDTLGRAGGMNAENWKTTNPNSGNGHAAVWIAPQTKQHHQTSVNTRWGLHTVGDAYGSPAKITELDDTTPERKEIHTKVLEERNGKLLKNLQNQQPLQGTVEREAPPQVPGEAVPHGAVGGEAGKKCPVDTNNLALLWGNDAQTKMDIIVGIRRSLHPLSIEESPSCIFGDIHVWEHDGDKKYLGTFAQVMENIPGAEMNDKILIVKYDKTKISPDDAKHIDTLKTLHKRAGSDIKNKQKREKREKGMQALSQRIEEQKQELPQHLKSLSMKNDEITSLMTSLGNEEANVQMKAIFANPTNMTEGAIKQFHEKIENTDYAEAIKNATIQQVYSALSSLDVEKKNAPRATAAATQISQPQGPVAEAEAAPADPEEQLKEALRKIKTINNVEYTAQNYLSIYQGIKIAYDDHMLTKLESFEPNSLPDHMRSAQMDDETGRLRYFLNTAKEDPLLKEKTLFDIYYLVISLQREKEEQQQSRT